MAITLLRRGQLIPVPPVERALRFLAGPRSANAAHPTSVAPSSALPTTVRRELEAIAEEYGADEVMLVTITYDHEARRRSYELVAERSTSRTCPARRRSLGPGGRVRRDEH